MKAGDTVQLKSGGPLMTVEKITNQTASCQWFDDKNLKEAEFLVSSLKEVDGSELVPRPYGGTRMVRS